MSENKTNGTFRDKASFGKRIEYSIIAKMLEEGMDVYVPLVDDNGIDAVVRNPDGSFVEVQIKARSTKVKPGDEALFAAIRHESRPNYWFVFYAHGVYPTIKSESAQTMTWILSSKEFIESSSQNKRGRNVGLRTIKFNGYSQKKGVPYANPKYDKYRVLKLSDRITKEVPTWIKPKSHGGEDEPKATRQQA